MLIKLLTENVVNQEAQENVLISTELQTVSKENVKSVIVT